MSEQVLYDHIARFFAERLNARVSSKDEDLFETGVLDSMVFVDLVLHLEQEFGIRVSADDLELDNFRTLAKITAFVAAHKVLR